jgi:anti-sigma factor ChrR (cupin superfamily)
MNVLVVGAAVAAVIAGPTLYGLVQSGQLDSTTAMVRGVLIAGACAGGVALIMRLVQEYTHEHEREDERQAKEDALLTVIAEAEEAARRQADAAAKRQADVAAAATAATTAKTDQPPKP